MGRNGTCERPKAAVTERLEVRTLRTTYGMSTVAPFATGEAAYAPVAVDAAADLFGTTTAATGAATYGAVYEIVKGTTTLQDLATFNAAGRCNANGGVVDAGGNLFGTTLGCGPDG